MTTYKDKDGKIITKAEYERLQKGIKETKTSKKKKEKDHADKIISDSR